MRRFIVFALIIFNVFVLIKIVVADAVHRHYDLVYPPSNETSVSGTSGFHPNNNRPEGSTITNRRLGTLRVTYRTWPNGPQCFIIAENQTNCFTSDIAPDCESVYVQASQAWSPAYMTTFKHRWVWGNSWTVTNDTFFTSPTGYQSTQAHFNGTANPC
jgi:hypothetical protein